MIFKIQDDGVLVINPTYTTTLNNNTTSTVIGKPYFASNWYSNRYCCDVLGYASANTPPINVGCVDFVPSRLPTRNPLKKQSSSNPSFVPYAATKSPISSLYPYKSTSNTLSSIAASLIPTKNPTTQSNDDSEIAYRGTVDKALYRS